MTLLKLPIKILIFLLMIILGLLTYIITPRQVSEEIETWGGLRKWIKEIWGTINEI